MTTVSAVSFDQRRSKCFSPPSAQAISAGTRSDLSRIISTWHLRIAEAALYSISFGPCAVIISPA